MRSQAGKACDVGTDGIALTQRPFRPAGGNTRVVHITQTKRNVSTCNTCSAPARDPLAAARGYGDTAAELWAKGESLPSSNTKKAISQWQKALAAAVEERGRVPDDVLDQLEQRLHSNLAAGHLRIHNFAEAKKSAAAAVRMDPACPKARYRLGEAHAGMGSWTEAEQVVQDLQDAGHDQAALLLRRSLQAFRKEAHRTEKALASRMLGGVAEGTQLDTMD
mmetsp:Transcript_35135/g.80979  ORF Transcript_35135/g.80979 Transcript_35135/m.80979 type:complete len:221 (-) Transcript_35135:12-674(-)